MLALSACWPLAGGEVSHRASVLNTCTDERFRGRGKILRISIIVARAYQECALTAWEGRPTAWLILSWLDARTCMVVVDGELNHTVIFEPVLEAFPAVFGLALAVTLPIVRIKGMRRIGI